MLGDDLAHRERHVAQNADGELAAGDELLGHDLVVVAGGFRDRGVEVLGLLHQREAHRRSLLGGLDDHRPAEGGRDVLGGDRRHEPRRCGHARGAEQALGEVLVHRQRARERAASGVGDADHVEHGLERAALAAPAVEAGEEHLGPGHGGESRDPLRQEAPLALVEVREVRQGAAHVAGEQPPLVLGGEQAAGRIDDAHFMLPLAQRGDDLGGARERHGPLGRRPAGEHGDLHQRMPASWCSRS